MNIRIILDRFLAIFDIHFFIFQYKEAHMYTNNAYLNHSTIDRKDKSKPLVVTMCEHISYTHVLNCLPGDLVADLIFS